MEAVAPFQDAIEIIKEEGGEIAKMCYQCGLCTGACPWNLVRSFIVRKATSFRGVAEPSFYRSLRCQRSLSPGPSPSEGPGEREGFVLIHSKDL